MTPVSRSDALVTNLIEQIIDFVFGAKEIGPVLIQPLNDSTFNLCRFLQRVLSDGDFVEHDFDGAMLDTFWEKVRKRAANVISNWSKQIPARQFLGSLRIYDAVTSYGRDLEVEGKQLQQGSVEDSITCVAKHSGYSASALLREWRELSDCCNAETEKRASPQISWTMRLIMTCSFCASRAKSPREVNPWDCRHCIDFVEDRSYDKYNNMHSRCSVVLMFVLPSVGRAWQNWGWGWLGLGWPDLRIVGIKHVWPPSLA